MEKQLKLKKDDIIIVLNDLDGLKKGGRYRVNKIWERGEGNFLYQFKANRKNAVAVTNIYTDWIDCEVNDKTTSQVDNPLWFVFAKSIVIVR